MAALRGLLRMRIALQHDEAEGMVVLRPRRMLLAEDLAPLASVEIGEPGVGMGRRMHLGEIDAARLRQDRAEDALAADHHNLADACFGGGAAGLPKPFLKTVGDDGARDSKAFVACEDDVDALVEHAA